LFITVYVLVNTFPLDMEIMLYQL